MMRRRGPGLIGAAARTAVIAGTATAVSGRVARRQAARYEGEQGGQPQAEPAPAAGPAGQDDTVAELQQLAALKDQGILSEEEFTAKKKQILGI
jgi:succinate dehydrogenase/fumarate reductase flavoprotein subunit